MSIPKLKLLSSTDSANLAGVGVDTIIQYKDLGLLRVQSIEGEDFFEEEDIKLIFNSRRKDPRVAGVQPQNINEDSDLPTLTSILKEGPTNLGTDTKDSKVVRIHAEKPELKLQVQAEIKEEIPEQIYSQAIQGEVEKSKSNKSGNSYLDFEGPSSIEILELSRSLKQQLELVMSERDWLRQRVEKLELQLERQQMISMSETETLRLLAKGREPSPSPWAFLLSWTQPKNK